MNEENLTQELEKLKLSAIECYRNEQFEALPKILRSMIDLGSAWALHYLAAIRMDME